MIQTIIGVALGVILGACVMFGLCVCLLTTKLGMKLYNYLINTAVKVQLGLEENECPSEEES
jgi:hypothetical protein